MHSNMNTSPAGPPRIGKAERKHKVVVIKVGTSSLLRKGHLHLSMLGALAEHGQVQVALAQQGARANLNHDHLVLAFRLSNPRGPRGRRIHV